MGALPTSGEIIDREWVGMDLEFSHPFPAGMEYPEGWGPREDGIPRG